MTTPRKKPAANNKPYEALPTFLEEGADAMLQNGDHNSNTWLLSHSVSITAQNTFSRNDTQIVELDTNFCWGNLIYLYPLLKAPAEIQYKYQL